MSAGQALFQRFSVMKPAKSLVNPSARCIVVAVKRVGTSASETGLLQTEALLHGFKSYLIAK